jgi:hypothetical protein
MRTRYKNAFRNKVLRRIKSLRGEVVLWADLRNLGSSRQVSRALKECVEDGTLARIGRGIYAKTKKSQYIDKPVIRGSFEAVSIEALNRLNIRWELGQLIKDYNEGRSQQVPAQLQIRLKDRFRRTLASGKNRILFEGNINAK